MMLSLVMLTYGVKGAEKMLACGSLVVVVSLVAFSINVFLNGTRGGAGTKKVSEENHSLASPPAKLLYQRYEHRRDQI